MKLSEYYEKGPNKPQKPQILAFNNEVKEAQMMAKVTDLEGKIAHFEAIEEEKAVIRGQLQAQTEEKEALLHIVEENNAKITNFEAQMQEKQRLLEEVDTLQRTNTNLDILHGENQARLNELREVYGTQSHEVVQLRTNIANLEVGQHTAYNEGLNKDTLLQELSTALGDLKERHEGLTSFSDELGHKYAEISEERDKLDKNNIKLHGDLLILQKQQENFSSEGKYNIERREQAVAQRVRNTMNKQTEELQQDVKDLVNLNTFYKTELSKPQHLSIGAIARQEGFKIPLASSAINYRKNNLGTGKPTLLKFGAKESS
jgi:chromosome segregation ATPase